jgi:excisionase family DNA binding protein
MMLTLKQAAERLGLAERTLRIQAAAGKLKATRYGGDDGNANRAMWLVSEEEVERYRREHKR